MTSVSFQASYDRLSMQGVDFGGHNTIWGTYPMGVLLNHRTFGHDFTEFCLFFSPFLHMLGNFFRKLPRIGPWSSHHYKGCSSCATDNWVCTIWQGIRGSVVRTQSRKVEVKPYYLDILLKITGSSLLKLRYERCFRLSSRTTTLRRRGLDSSKAHVVAGPWAEAAAAIAVNGRGWGRPDQAGQQSRRLYFSRCVEVVVWSFFFCFAVLCKDERDLALYY